MKHKCFYSLELAKMGYQAIERYGKALTQHDVLKCLALMLMTIDHIGLFFFPEDPIFRILGRGAAPLFFFLIGFNQNLRKYPLLLLYGGILSVMYYVTEGTVMFNILITFILSYELANRFLFREFKPYQITLVYIALVLLGLVINNQLEYFPQSLLMMHAGYCVRHKTAFTRIWVAYALGLYYAIQILQFDFLHNWVDYFLILISILTLHTLMVNFNGKMSNFQGRGKVILEWISRTSIHLYFWHFFLLWVFAKHLIITI